MLLDCYVGADNKEIINIAYCGIRKEHIINGKKYRLDNHSRAEERLERMNNDFNNPKRKSI